MSTIAILGATGTAGSLVAEEAAARGHDVIAVTRSHGVDLLTGEGLAEAIAGADSVIDASNPWGSGTAEETFAVVAANVARACQEAATRNLVVLSIAGIDSPAFDGFDYYLGKRRQEAVVRASGVPFSILQSAQWFEFAVKSSAVHEEAGDVVVEDWLVQPIAVSTVAGLLVDLATASPLAGTRIVAGPDRLRLPEVTRRYLDEIGDSRRVRTIPARLPGFSDGSLTPASGVEVHQPSLGQWLTTVQRPAR